MFTDLIRVNIWKSFFLLRAIGILVLLASACSPSPAPLPPPTLAPTFLPAPTTILSPVSTVVPPTAATIPLQVPSLAPTAIPLTQLAMKGGEFYLDAPDQIEAGFVRVVFQNVGARVHNLKIWKLKPGKTITDVKGVEDLGSVFLTIDTFHGGVNSTSPGGSKLVIVELAEGDYVLVSAPPQSGIRDHDIAKGMAKMLRVVARTSPAAAEPKADFTVILKEGATTLPANITAGMQSILLLNQGNQPRQILFVKMLAGKTLVDFQNAYNANNIFQAADPAWGSVGTAEFSPGKRIWITVDFQAGNYVAWDDFAGLKNGVAAFTVAAR